jgi:hypothetical protein
VNAIARLPPSKEDDSMTKATVTKLFAVVALTGACGLAEAERAADTKQPAKPAQVAAPKKQAQAPKQAPAPKQDKAPVAPRTLKNGRPANGNCTGKCPQ